MNVIKKLLYKLTNTVAVSGLESPLHEIIKGELESCTDNIIFDQSGSVIVEIGDKESDVNILFDAHIDQIGMVITNIDKNGFIKVVACGGVDRRVLVGHLVKIYGKQSIVGIVCPKYRQKNSDNDSFPSVEDIYIDTGINYDELINFISVGDRVSFYPQFSELLNDRVFSCALDNRIGVAILIKLIQQLYCLELKYKYTFLFSSQEEVSGMGAKINSYKLNPTKAIVIDGSFANQLNIDSYKYKSINMGGGPMIGISPIIPKDISDKFVDIATRHRIPYQLEVMGGKTGTNVDQISNLRAGIKCGLVSIPQRYMHSPVEVVDIQDIYNTVELLFYFVMDEEGR